MSNLRAKIKDKFSPDAIKLYREHFDTFDLNGDGVISARELDKVSRHMGYRLNRTEIRAIMGATDLDSSGSLSFEEFLMAMPGNNLIPDEEHKMAEVRRKFQEYDRDGNGMVTVEEAHAVLRKELAFSNSQTAELVKRYDKNGDGNLSYEEFVRFYRNVQTKATQIREMFHAFDRDRSGAVSVAEAQAMLSQIQIPEDEVKLLVAIHDKNKDGQLQYEEFVSFLLNS